MNKHASSDSTYAVSLYFDDASAEQLRLATERVSLAACNDYMTEHAVPPHITLGMFHAAENELPLLKKVFADFADKAGVTDNNVPTRAKALQKHYVFSFAGVKSFYDKVIFLYPAEEAAAYFKELNSILHEMFLPHFEAGGNRNYLPYNWFPHVALAVKLNHIQFQKGFEEAQRLFENGTLAESTIKIASLGLARCKPYTEISNFSI